MSILIFYLIVFSKKEIDWSTVDNSNGFYSCIIGTFKNQLQFFKLYDEIRKLQQFYILQIIQTQRAFMDHRNSDDNDSQSQSYNGNLGQLAPLDSPKQSQAQPLQTIVPKIQRPLVIKSSLQLDNESQPRLIIHKIVLQNFKSYADKQVIGPFHENFTSVVGPNGSGKSNLIESMLFIFGYNANWMRLNRLNQLIHKSSTMSTVQKAAVEVQFKKVRKQDDDQYTQIEEEGFSLRRVVKMSGGSKYYIDGVQSTQTQVKDKLKGEGIDLNNNRFLILQGEVQQISQMKQKSGDRDKPGLLEYLEDIIGSNIYIDKIEKLVTEYNLIEETKHEKGELMKIVEVQLRNMKKGKQQAIKFVKKQRYIYQIQNILHQVTIYNNKYELDKIKQKLQIAQAQRDRIVNQERQKLKKQAQRIRQIKKYKQQTESLQKMLLKQNEMMEKLNIADKNINQQISFKSEDLVKYNRKIGDLDRELSTIINESDEIRQKLPENKTKASQAKEKIDILESQLQKHDKPELRAKLKSLQTELKRCEHQYKSFTDKEKVLRRNFDAKYVKKQNTEIKLLDLNRKVEEESQMLEKINEAQSQASKIKTNLSAELQSLSSERKIAVNQLEKVEANLREHLHENKQISMFNNMFEKIMQQRIPGVLGRLGDLGSVSKKYDQIITSCCGRLDNIVVRNLDAANAVLNFLKATKLGRATCIILDKIQDYNKYMSKSWSNLPNSVRLFDQIQPRTQQIKVAFYFAISDTIYCENSQLGLEYAMKDDRNRRRVVSRKPNGYIIYELNGLMNGCPAKKGGFQVKAKSKMRNNASSQDIKGFEHDKEQLQGKIKRIQEKYRQIKKEQQGVEKDINQINRQKKAIEQNLREAKHEINDIQRNISKNNKQAEQQKARKQKQLKSIQEKITELQQRKQNIYTKIQEVEAQQKSLQSDKITQMRENYKILKTQHQQLDKEIQKQTAIIQTTVKRINQNKKSKEDLQKKIKMLENQVQKLQKQIEGVEKKATQIFGKISAAEEKLASLKKKQQELKVLEEQEDREVKESKLKIEKAREQVDNLKIQSSTYQDAMHNAQLQLQRTRQTYKQLSITYDFMEELDEIEFMNIEALKKNDQMNPADTSALINRSLDSNLSSSSKVFPAERLAQFSPFEDIEEDKIDKFLLFPEKLTALIVAEKQSLKKMSGSNLQIITEFRNKFIDFKERHKQFEAVRQAQMSLRKNIQELKQQRLTTFREGFSIINSKLKQVYQLLTRGGDAELQLIDSLDPFSDGINFSVRPPKKTWKQINKLSGGQKTLSSLSLIFALHYFKPTPLYFMDEIDAALDFRNVSIVADYIKQRTKNAQFIIISLRNNMFQLADKLVGVYKTYDKTKIVHFIPSRMRKNLRNGLDKQNMDHSNQN